MKKALFVSLALALGLSACSEDLETSAEVSKSMAEDPTAAGAMGEIDGMLDTCPQSKASLIEAGAPEAAVRAAGDCLPGQ